MCSRDQRHLGRAHEIEPVFLDRVVVALVGREEARAVHRLLAHQHGRQHGREALLDEPVERKPVQRERDAARCRRRGSRSAQPETAPRAPGRSGRPPCARAGSPAGGRPSAASRRRPRRPSRRPRTRAAGSEPSRALRRARPPPPPALPRAGSRSFTAFSSSICSGVGLPSSLLLRAQLVDLRHERAPALVRREQLVESLRRAAPRERRRGIRPDSLRAARRSIMRGSLGMPQAPGRRPPRRPTGRRDRRRSFTRSCAFSTATP